MIIRNLVSTGVLLCLVACSHQSDGRKVGKEGGGKALDIYFIDTEGGAATLIVTPAGESLLADSGNPGERDAGRIARVAKEVAGLKQIDHCLSTHWHGDHYGGAAPLSELIPIKSFWDRGIPDPLPAEVDQEMLAAYRKACRGQSKALNVGDKFPLKAAATPLDVTILASGGAVLGEEPGAPKIRACAKGHEPAEEDPSDNAMSLAFLLKFGKFTFFDGGDITWNVEHKLACPENLVGKVEVFQVNHHGLDSSNNPLHIHAMAPRVAILNNGPRKGGQDLTIETLRTSPGLEAIYQVHRNLVDEKNNPPSDFIANDAENCNAEFVKLSVDPTGESYTVEVPSKKTANRYPTGAISD